MASADILNGDLDALRFEDVERFLALNGPIDQRPPENVRLDYKGDLDPSFGKEVAAFANTFGGTILIGVTDKAEESSTPGAKSRSTNYPTDIVGVVPNGELKARIINIIQSSVQPAPQFRVVSLVGNGKEIAVIRIEEGDHPPYLHLGKNRMAIQCRRDGACHDVDYLQLEGLLSRRLRTNRYPWSDRPFLDVSSPMAPGFKGQLPAIVNMWFRPARELDVLLESYVEAEHGARLYRYFGVENGSTQRRRATSTYRGNAKPYDAPIYSQLTTAAEICFSFAMSGDSSAGGLPLGAVRMIQACRVARDTLAQVGYLGRIRVEVAFVAGVIPMASRWTPRNWGLDTLPEVLSPQPLEADEHTTTVHLIDHVALDNPFGLVSSSLVQHLRNSFGVAPSAERLASSIEGLCTVMQAEGRLTARYEPRRR